MGIYSRQLMLANACTIRKHKLCTLIYNNTKRKIIDILYTAMILQFHLHNFQQLHLYSNFSFTFCTCTVLILQGWQSCSLSFEHYGAARSSVGSNDMISGTLRQGPHVCYSDHSNQIKSLVLQVWSRMNSTLAVIIGKLFMLIGSVPKWLIGWITIRDSMAPALHLRILYTSLLFFDMCSPLRPSTRTNRVLWLKSKEHKILHGKNSALSDSLP